MAILEGERFSVHEPEAGNPFNITLPVADPEFGWVIVPIRGGSGFDGGAVITMLPDEGEVHPEVFFTVNV
jgi:hypothetical protein